MGLRLVRRQREAVCVCTASRDKSIKISELLPKGEEDKPFKLLQTVKFDEAVTSIAFGVDLVLAVGKEDGGVEILQRNVKDDEKEDQWTTTLRLAHVGAEQINQLAFRPPCWMMGTTRCLRRPRRMGLFG